MLRKKKSNWINLYNIPDQIQEALEKDLEISKPSDSLKERKDEMLKCLKEWKVANSRKIETIAWIIKKLDHEISCARMIEEKALNWGTIRSE